MSGRKSDFSLKQTNVSKPRLQPSSSRQSISATEDFQSARSSPDHLHPVPARPSSTSSNEGLLQGQHDQLEFSTPPSTPPGHLRQISSDLDDLPSGHTPAVPPSALVNSPSNMLIGQPIQRKPVGSPPSRRYSNAPVGLMDHDRGITPRPRSEDTPFIHFAIDQLTRDEEVRGSRLYAHPSVASTDFAGAERDVFAGKPSYPLRPDSSRPATSTAPQQPLSHSTLPQATNPFERNVAEPGHQGPRATEAASTLSIHDVLVPADRRDLNPRFVPAILRPAWMSLYAFVLLWVLIGLLVGGIWSATHNGLATYTTFGGPRYFVFQYLPVIIGTILTLWLFQIQVAVKRIAPFLAMASMNSTSRSEAPFMPVVATQFLFPDLYFFKSKQYVIGSCMFVFWLQIFNLPLLGCLYNVYFFGEPSTGAWIWLAVQGVNWLLFALFLLQIAAVILLCVRINTQITGLRWDPRSLADLIALLSRSNSLRDYEGSEVFASKTDFRRRLGLRTDRIGYWTTSSQTNRPLYTIGEEGADTRRYTLDQGKIQEKPRILEPRSSFPDTPTTVRVNQSTIDLDSDEEYSCVRFAHLPWYLKPVWVLVWSFAAVLLYLAFLIVSFVNQPVLHGFAPLTPVAPSAEGFSSTNFLYSFVPGTIAQLLFLSWLSVDYAFRRLQPFTNLAHIDGEPAETSVLLEYPAQAPVAVTIAALVSGDMHVAWFSFVSLLAATLPTLASGCFWAQFYIADQQVRVAVDTAAFYALCVFLALYAASLPMIFFGINYRRLPHAATTLAELFSWFYQSHLVSERDWSLPSMRRLDVVTALVAPVTEDEKRVGRGLGRLYFGRFTGRDGNTHVGIQRIGNNLLPNARQSGHWFGQNGPPQHTPYV